MPVPAPEMKPSLSAAQLKEHPGFQHLEWDLPATKEGWCSVAKGRGGPFKIWYEVHGEGETKLVWITGLGSYRTAWKSQTRYFGHHNSSKYSSLIMDNRGIAKSDKPTLRYTTLEMAKDTVDLVDHLGWTASRSLHIIGVSMGGMIAQEIGLLIPDRIASLSLISTGPRIVRTVPFVENLRQRINMFIPRDLDVQLTEVKYRLFSKEFLEAPDRDDREITRKTNSRFPTNGDRVAASELRKRMDTAGFTRKGFILQAIAAGWHHKSAAQLKSLADSVGRSRILVMHGTADRMITFEHAELLRAELGDGIVYVVHDKLGHVIMWEIADEFNRTMQDHFRNCGGSGD